ncbi:hypothetical protein B0H67DRAFT_448491, partial [Lasiosphaeris hirsuta]
FFVPDDLDISSALSQLLAAVPPPPNQHLDGQLLAYLIAQLDIAPGRGGAFRQFFSFPIFSNGLDLAFGDRLLPAWKWVKPGGDYRKKG